MMRLPTCIGTIAVETDWSLLETFLALKRTTLRAKEEREVSLRVSLASPDEIDLPPADDAADAYPRHVYVQRSAFTIWRDHIEGKVPRNVRHAGNLLDWIWYALAICCAPEGWEPVHAAAVERDGEATIIFGGNGSGKTTHAVEMMQAGWRYLSDDIVLLSADGTRARGWDRDLHLDARAAQALGHSHQHLDWSGKVRCPAPSGPRRLEARVAGALFTGGSTSTRHDGQGFDSAWVNDYGAGRRLLASARRATPRRLEARVAVVNRNPDAPGTRWWGGDMVHALGYVEGLRALGVQAEFVPSDQLDESRYDLIHLMHAQFTWSKEVAERATRPLVVSAITQHEPTWNTLGPAVRRASAVLCYSIAEEEFYRQAFPGEPRAKFVSAPLGVPEGLYRQAAAAPRSPSVFMPGNYLPVKNQTAVLRACRTLDVPVVFAGGIEFPGAGEYIAQLRAEAADWRGARFFGRLSGEALWRRYREAWVVPQPSEWEAFGLCAWEGLAAGANVIVTRRGWGWPVFEPHATVCDPDDASVKAAIERELRLPRDRHHFRPPTWKDAARALLPIYRRVLAG